jgi:transcriptional regulator GlxA family with amidase domain
MHQRRYRGALDRHVEKVSPACRRTNLRGRSVEVAQRLLRDTAQDLSWIANETGFSSQSHFTAWFRLVTGYTPARFRERR